MTLKATHINFQHPNHLRVIDGKTHTAWNIVKGFYETDAVCWAPSTSTYNKLNTGKLPCWSSRGRNRLPKDCEHCQALEKYNKGEISSVEFLRIMADIASDNLNLT